MKYLATCFLVVIILSNSLNFIFDYNIGFKVYKSYLILLCDLIIIIIGLFCINKTKSVYKYFFYALLLSSCFTYILGDYNIITHLNGLRELIGTFSVIFILDKIFHQKNLLNTIQFIRNFRKFILIFLIAQIPISLMQFFEYGAGDYVGGTWGLGASGTITLLSLISTYFLIITDKNIKYTSKISPIIILKYSLFIIPCLINETKITFILLPIMFATLLRVRASSLLIIPLFLIGFYSYFQFYDKTAGASFKKDNNDIFSKEYISEYLFSNDYERYIDIDNNFIDIPRYTKIYLSFSSMSKEPTEIIFGNEYGLFKGFSFLGQSAKSRKNILILKGSITYFFFLFYQGGIMLFFIFLFFYFSIFIKTLKNTINNTNYRNYISYLAFSTLIIFLYNDTLRYLGFYSILLTTIYTINYIISFKHENTYHM